MMFHSTINRWAFVAAFFAVNNLSQHSSHVTGPRFVNDLRHNAWKDTYATV